MPQAAAGLQDPDRVHDRELLEAITNTVDALGEAALDSSLTHPHAVLDIAHRRVIESGMGHNDPQIVAAVMALWVDGFMAGQRMMAKHLGIDLDQEQA